MVTLEVWYDQEPDNDFSEGDPTILVSTPEDMDALLDRVQRETKDATVPPMLECSVSGDPMRGACNIGVGHDKGFLMFMTPEPAQTEGDPTLAGEVAYDYMGHLREIPARFEVPMDVVRAGAREFVRTGTFPACVAVGDG